MIIKGKTNTQNLKTLTGTVEKIKDLLKTETGLVYITLGNMGSSVLGGLLWFVLAGLLSVDNYGVVNYYIALANIFFSFGLWA